MAPGDFFDRVLASTGRRCVCAKTAKGMLQVFGSSNLWAAEAAGRLDTNSKDTYIAVATFGDEENRKARNAVAARSHFLDIDCGPGKAYAAKREGVEALVRFCSAVGLPSPLIVDSGGGLHAWFVHDEDMEPVEWKRVADKLKEACRRYGLAQDPACTADIARLLRIPGTHNRKAGGKREVKVIHAGHVTAPKAFEQALDAALAASGGFDGADAPELPPGRPARSLRPGGNDDLGAGIRSHWWDYLTDSQKDSCLAEMLGYLSHVAEGGRQEWIKIVAACARSGAPNAFAICREWSRKGTTYDERQFIRDFRSFS